ncbi:NisI/SpaI family lantibiotic immunity lipoprotein [Scatolibacter rhodanostii]|uniref:NisI/SpaI family lantibiotic immunity lipoprotein n=1 Tax=Scatolibacter rhodanostii TaxID=2014781 RepID=UPI000C088A79|nr:NisI/SpaI family lantibiotic immunity lipoprotein [Scatolibacter rhodanostii]
MKKNTFTLILSAILLMVFFSGCSSLNQKIEEYSKDKEQAYLNSDVATQFIYKETNYTILNDTVAEENLGNWVGYIRKFAVIDKDGKMLLQQDIKETTFETLDDIADDYPEASSILSFLNIYEAKESIETQLVVNVNDKFYKAIQTNLKNDSDQIFDYRQNPDKGSSESFTVNSENSTQLISGENIYQITDQMIPEEDIGEYLDVIAQSIVFDGETKLKISKEDLSKLDWDGKNSEAKKRENWFYGEVHAVQDTDVSESIAVEINFEYRLATRL